MKVKMILTIAAIALISFNAQAQADPKPELLSLQTVRVGDGIEVSVPLVRVADGSICQTYVSDASRDPYTGSVSVELDKVCGNEAHATNLFGASVVYPANLISMEAVTADGLTVQKPSLKGSVPRNSVVIKDTRTANAAPLSAGGAIPALGELLTRRDGVCGLTHFKQTSERIPMPVIETRTYPCDEQGKPV